MNACDWIVPFVYVFALGWNYSIHQSSLYLLHVFVQFPFIVRARFPIPKNCTGSWIIYLYAGGFQWPIWSTYTVIKRKLWQRTGNCIILSKRMTAGADETPKWCQYTTNKRTFILSFCWFLIVKWLQANCRPIKMNTHRLLWVYYLRATEQGKRNKLRNEQVSMENRKKRKKNCHNDINSNIEIHTTIEAHSPSVVKRLHFMCHYFCIVIDTCYISNET